VFGADVKLNFMALQNCQRGLNYQDFAKGQLINTRVCTSVARMTLSRLGELTSREYARLNKFTYPVIRPCIASQ
jgi:hypothetical protein